LVDREKDQGSKKHDDAGTGANGADWPFGSEENNPFARKPLRRLSSVAPSELGASGV
jgi:hypothetical protein